MKCAGGFCRRRIRRGRFVLPRLLRVLRVLRDPLELGGMNPNDFLHCQKKREHVHHALLRQFTQCVVVHSHHALRRITKELSSPGPHGGPNLQPNTVRRDLQRRVFRDVQKLQNRALNDQTKAVSNRRKFFNHGTFDARACIQKHNTVQTNGELGPPLRKRAEHESNAVGRRAMRRKRVKHASNAVGRRAMRSGGPSLRSG